MSYTNTARRRVMLPGEMYKRGSLGGIGDQLSSAINNVIGRPDAPNAACDAAGRQAQAVYDAQMADVAKAFAGRDGFYKIDDAQAIIAKGLAFQAAGQAVLDKVDATYGEFGQTSLKTARTQAFNGLIEVGKLSRDFQIAIDTARSRGATVIDAPGIKDWVIDCISAAGYAAYVAAYVTCAMPAGAALIIAAMRTWTAIGTAFIAIVKAAGRVAVTAADVVYKTTVGTLNFASTVIKYAPWILLAYGGALIYQKAQRR